MMPTMLLLLAVVEKNTSALDKLKQVPPAFWLKVGIAVLAIVLLVIVLRKLAEMNKVVLTVGLLVLFSTLGFSWVYNRNEPTWATPVVEKLAAFLPSKATYPAKPAPKP